MKTSEKCNERSKTSGRKFGGCEIGLNEDTGRIQWCAGCRCVKFLFIIPATMLPIVLILALFTNLDVVGSIKHKVYDRPKALGKIEGAFNESNNCISVKTGFSEVIEAEEREVLKDVRTSFIPAELNCLEQMDEENKKKQKIISYFKRRRRWSHGKYLPITARNHGTFEDIRAAQVEIMKKYMDIKADPCTDFYQYACGNWEKTNPIPKDKAALDTFEMLRESLDFVIRNLLLERNDGTTLDMSNFLDEQIVTSKPKISNEQLRRVRKRIMRKRTVLNSLIMRNQVKRVKRREIVPPDDAEIKARNLFVSCMNYSIIEKRGIEPLKDLLKSLGGWPILDPDWNAEEFDWLDLVANVRLYNNDILIMQWVGPDIKNSDLNIMQIDQTNLGLPSREYFLQTTNQKYLDAYRAFIIDIISLLGVPIDKAVQEANEILEFEIELANITITPEERNNVSAIYRKMLVEELQDRIPEIDWIRYLSIIQERPVNSSEFIVMFAASYMDELVTLLSQTQPRTIANYILWRFVRHRINNLDDRFIEAKQKFSNVLFGREQSPARWKNCVSQVNLNMGMAVGAMFVRRYFDENSKLDTLTMTHELQDSFRDILTETDWLDPPTKHLAELKVNAMSLRIGYPDYILSHKDLNQKYEDLQIDPEKYFENTLNVLKHIRRQEQMKLGQMVNKTAWNTAPAIVNAYYSRNKNQIMFPAGILQPPFYHRYFPRAMNYGGIGVVIGHELTHGFDDKGRLFDRDGNLHRWWSESSVDAFHERAACLITQYGKYTIDEIGVQVDGENTQGENIADNGGIKQAFRAYKKWLLHQTDEDVLQFERLDGLNLTNTQLFFLNFAHVWCGAMRPEATLNKVKTAVHSPGKFRVIGALSNSDDFAEAYQCPVGSPMNPKTKCRVW